jgi:ribosomal protein L11 methylase PrmA
MNAVRYDAGSFRDPGGRVLISGDRVYRTIMPSAAAAFRAVSETGLFGELFEREWLLPFEEKADLDLGADVRGHETLLESTRLRTLSWPYEWSFSVLRRAALLHLDIHLASMERGVTLSDATAYNIQFVGPDPVFIDHLSFRPYTDGEYWRGHRQFCEQFLNPLLLRARCGISHNHWYRGALEGIPAPALSRMLPWTKLLSPRLLAHVVLPARFERLAMKSDNSRLSKSLKDVPFRRESHLRLLRGLRSWIAALRLPREGETVWSRYAETAGYSDREEDAKHAFVAEAVGRCAPGVVWDIGCNTGDYAKVALGAGAGEVVGFESDAGALELAYGRARAEKLRFLPLYMDIANPSPAQGWRSVERPGLAERQAPDMVLALAVLHHMCIGRNVPLDDAVDYLISLAPAGVIEFVPKADPKVRQLLSMREDIFDGYTEEAFFRAVESRASVVRTDAVTDTGRKLVWYDRNR